MVSFPVKGGFPLHMTLLAVFFLQLCYLVTSAPLPSPSPMLKSYQETGKLPQSSTLLNKTSELIKASWEKYMTMLDCAEAMVASGYWPSGFPVNELEKNYKGAAEYAHSYHIELSHLAQLVDYKVKDNNRNPKNGKLNYRITVLKRLAAEYERQLHNDVSSTYIPMKLDKNQQHAALQWLAQQRANILKKAHARKEDYKKNMDYRPRLYEINEPDIEAVPMPFPEFIQRRNSQVLPGRIPAQASSSSKGPSGPKSAATPSKQAYHPREDYLEEAGSDEYYDDEDELYSDEEDYSDKQESFRLPPQSQQGLPRSHQGTPQSQQKGPPPPQQMPSRHPPGSDYPPRGPPQSTNPQRGQSQPQSGPGYPYQGPPQTTNQPRGPSQPQSGGGYPQQMPPHSQQGPNHPQQMAPVPGQGPSHPQQMAHGPWQGPGHPQQLIPIPQQGGAYHPIYNTGNMPTDMHSNYPPNMQQNFQGTGGYGGMPSNLDQMSLTQPPYASPYGHFYPQGQAYGSVPYMPSHPDYPPNRSAFDTESIDDWKDPNFNTPYPFGSH